MAGSPRPRRHQHQRGGSSSKRRYGGPKKDQQIERFSSEIESMNKDAEERFERDPRPMAFPKDMEPPRTFHLSWKPEPVPLKAEERVASMVVKRGDFGWLPEERVDEMASSLEGEAMNLDLSLIHI